MKKILRLFGIGSGIRDDIPVGLRGTGVTGGTGLFDEYFNQALFESQVDHVVNTEAKVKETDPTEGTIYVDLSDGLFKDKDDATVTILNGDRIHWVEFGALTTDIDLSAVDDIFHSIESGNTLATGTKSIILGKDQKGEIKYSGVVTIKSGPIQLIDTGSNYEEFRTENLIINVQTTDTVDADADSISFFNVSSIPTRIFNLNHTFDIADIMAGTSAKILTWYQLWIDSEGVGVPVPDLEGSADANVLNSLSDSTAAWLTDKVQINDIIFQTTDGTKGFVKAISTENVLTIKDESGADLDLFPLGTESYKIRLLSPEGLGEHKARIGAAFRNSSGDLTTHKYTDKNRGGVLQFTQEDIGRGTTTAIAFPNDDSIPQNTEGSNIFTSASFTPRSSISKILIEFAIQTGESSNVANAMAAALFQSGGTNALRVQSNYVSGDGGANNGGSTIVIRHVMDSWGLTGKTFAINLASCNAYNYQYAGAAFASAIFGASTTGTFFTITEYEV